MTNTLTIGERIAHLRTSKGMSQAELRRRTGLNIWRMEQDQFQPNIASLRKIATELEIELHELLK